MTIDSYATTRTVSAIAVIDLANELMKQNIIKDSYLSRLGNDFSSLYKLWENNRPIQELRLPEPLLLSLWQQANAESENLDIGIRVGAYVNHSAKGVLANWLSQSSSLAEAFSIFSENITLLNPSECWKQSETDKQVKLSVSFSSSKYPNIAIERSLAAMLSWSRALSNTNFFPHKVLLKRPRPNNTESYIKLFGNNVHFGQIEHSLLFNKNDFYKPIIQANPYLKGILAKEANKLKQQLPRKQLTMTEIVNSLLLKDLSHYCHIETCCHHLHLSRTTLYRKLKKQGTSFSSLVKDARLSKTYNSTNMSDVELSEILGFKDLSSFYRFRKKAVQ